MPKQKKASSSERTGNKHRARRNASLTKTKCVSCVVSYYDK